MTVDAVLSDINGDLWRVRRLSLSEGIDALYEATLRIQSDEVPRDPAELLGTDATLTLRHPGHERQLHGIISSVERGDARDGWVEGTITLVPAAWSLSVGTSTRIFQDVSVKKIISLVWEKELANYGRTVDLAGFAGGTTEREYCVQYRESDYAFVTRLLREEGAGFLFDHTGAHEVLRVFDSNGAFGVATLLDGTSTLHWGLPVDPALDTEGVTSFEATPRLNPTATAVLDYDWTRPNTPFLKRLETPGPDAHDRVRTLHRTPLELSGYEGAAYTTTDADSVAKHHNDRV